MLLSIGVTLPAILLAFQCILTEGFWPAKPAIELKTCSQPTEKVEADPRKSIEVPGIARTSADCDPVRRSRFGRAISMIQPRPKLQLLPDRRLSMSIATGVKPSQAPADAGHMRLRSLTLPKRTSAVRSDSDSGKANLEDRIDAVSIDSQALTLALLSAYETRSPVHTPAEPQFQPRTPEQHQAHRESKKPRQRESTSSKRGHKRSSMVLPSEYVTTRAKSKSKAAATHSDVREEVKAATTLVIRKSLANSTTSDGERPIEELDAGLNETDLGTVRRPSHSSTSFASLASPTILRTNAPETESASRHGETSSGSLSSRGFMNLMSTSCKALLDYFYASCCMLTGPQHGI